MRRTNGRGSAPASAAAAVDSTRAWSIVRRNAPSSKQKNSKRGRPSGDGLGKGSEGGSVLSGRCSRVRRMPLGVVYTANHVGPLRPSATGQLSVGPLEKDGTAQVLDVKEDMVGCKFREVR